MITELGEQDMIASTDFSCCRALAGINDNGQALFCHISSGWAEEELILILKKKFGAKKLHYIYPCEEFEENAPRKSVEMGKHQEEKYLGIAEKFDLIPHKYPEVGAGQGTFNRHKIIGSSICLTKIGIHLAGFNFEFYDKQGKNPNPYNGSRYYHDVKESSRTDIEF